MTYNLCRPAISSLLLSVSICIVYFALPRYVYSAPLQKLNYYVGSLACKDCHLKEYNSFVAFAKKSYSFQSIERLRKV